MAPLTRHAAAALTLLFASVLFSGCTDPTKDAPSILVTDPVIVPFAQAFAADRLTVGVVPPSSLRTDTPDVRLIVVDTVRDGPDAKRSIDRRDHGNEPWILDIREDITPAAGPDGAPDPHAWTDPVRAAAMVQNLMWGFITIEPERRVDHETTAAGLADALDALHERFLEGVGQCDTRHMLVTEIRYSHWVHRYNLYQHDASALDEDERRHLVERLGITTLFHAPGAEEEAQRIATPLGLAPIPLVFPGDAGSTTIPGHFDTLGTAIERLRSGLGCL